LPVPEPEKAVAMSDAARIVGRIQNPVKPQNRRVCAAPRLFFLDPNSERL
jgi:hypothetical protein